MGSCFVLVASETLRRGVVGGGSADSVSITLEPMPNQANRARAAALYRVLVTVPLGPDAWSNGVWLVDARGYRVAWSYQAVGKWLVKSLSGSRVAVNLTVLDASGLPAKWTAARLESLGGKVSAISAPGVLADAAAKVAAVSGWAVSDRRAAVEQAAARMVEAAALVTQVQAMQGGSDWGVVPDGGGETGGGGSGPLELSTNVESSSCTLAGGESLEVGAQVYNGWYTLRVNRVSGDDVTFSAQIFNEDGSMVTSDYVSGSGITFVVSGGRLRIVIESPGNVTFTVNLSKAD